MIYYSDIVYPDFSYPEELNNLIIWSHHTDEEENVYLVNEYRCDTKDECLELVQSIWSAVCKNYHIQSEGFTYITKYQIPAVDMKIDNEYEPIMIGGIQTSMSHAMFFAQELKYTEYVIAFVEDIVRTVLADLINFGNATYYVYRWYISNKTVDEVIKNG